MNSPPNSLSPHRQTWFHYLAVLVFVAMAVVAAIEMRIREPIPGFIAAMDDAIRTATCEGLSVLTRYTGIEGVDLSLQVLVTAFLPGPAGLDRGFQIIQAYFLAAFFPVVSIWCVESARKGNQRSLISFPAIYSLFYQTVGGAIVIPCYYLAHMYTVARRRNYSTAGSSVVPVAFAKALTPSLVLGYLLPTILMSLPGSVWEDATRQRLIAIWQPCPLYVSLLLQVFAQLFSFSSAESSVRTTELKHLKTLYAVCFVVSAICHLGTLAYCITSDDQNSSLGAAFDLRRITNGSPLVGSLKYIFQVDCWIILAASLVWAYVAVYDTRQLGKTRVGMTSALVYFVSGTVLVGPAAVLSATWYWRETMLHKIKTS